MELVSEGYLSVKIQDLLEPDNQDVRIREDPEAGVFVYGVNW